MLVKIKSKREKNYTSFNSIYKVEVTTVNGENAIRVYFDGFKDTILCDKWDIIIEENEAE